MKFVKRLLNNLARYVHFAEIHWKSISIMTWDEVVSVSQYRSKI